MSFIDILLLVLMLVIAAAVTVLTRAYVRRLDRAYRATGISEAPVPLLNKVVTADDAGQGDRRLCDRRVACPCCIAALVAESTNYKSLQETLANTTLHCFRRMQP